MRIKLGKRSILVLLISLDVLFIVLSLAHFAVDNISPNYSGFLLNSNLSVEKDGGYPEIFQYVKEVIIIVTFLLLFIRTHSAMYFSWVLVFSYLLLDDSLKLHERFGSLLSVYFDLTPLIGLRAQDFGELIASVIFGIILLIFVAVGYYLSNPIRRKISRNILFMLFGLAFFGVLVDMIHVVLKFSFVQRIVGTLEDGGEMLIMSIIVWYVLKLYYCDYHQNIDTKITAAIDKSG